MKLVTLDTIHWYCEGPEPTAAARHHDSQARRRKFVAQYLLLFLKFLVVYLTPFFRPSLCINGRRKEEGLHQVIGDCTEEGGNGSIQPIHKEETVGQDRPST